jgi:signal transduction histidine kinase
LISRVAQGETITLDAVINLLDETQQAIRYSRELERKSRELEGTAAELRRANDQLTRLDKMKDDFLSQVSHELRTPMTSIRSFSEILVSSGDIDEEQSRRFLSVIQHESERLTRLLDEILELSRLENGQLESVPVPTDAVEVMRGAIETMRGLTHGRGVTVHDELGSESVMVLADPDRLKQVCINLLSNAAKFSAGEGAAVWVSGGERDGMAVIDVRDNGPGIPADVRETLFQKFSRGWSANYKTDSGSGLGLAISKRLMLLMKGDLRLTDTGPEGTCFTIHMSASREAQSAAE